MREVQHVGFQVNKKTNNVLAVLDLGFMNFSKTVDTAYTYISQRYPHKRTGAISVSAFVKHFNLYVCKTLAYNQLYIDNMKRFSEKVFEYASNVRLADMNCTLQHLMTDKTDLRFIYGSFKIERANAGYVLMVNGDTPIHIDDDDLLSLMNTFYSTYKGPMKKYLHELDCELVFGGFVYKIPYKNKFRYEYLSGVVLLTNQYGVFSESYKEVEMYNHIMDYIVRNKKKAIFFKPDFYEPSPYENGYLTDGVVILPGRRIYYVEVFGMNNPEYELKKAYKQNQLKGKLIGWTPGKESLPNLSKYF